MCSKLSYVVNLSMIVCDWMRRAMYEKKFSFAINTLRPI